MCQGGPPDDSSCAASSDHVNSSCVPAVLKCDPNSVQISKCEVQIRDRNKLTACNFNQYQDKTIEESITCCPCDGSDVFPSPWWDCNTPSSSEYNSIT